MTMIDHLPSAGNFDSKSKVAELQKKIEELVKEAYETGDNSVMARAAQLSREKENLLKPASMRSAMFRKAG